MLDKFINESQLEGAAAVACSELLDGWLKCCIISALTSYICQHQVIIESNKE
jgi:hypothetical protein